MERLQSTHKKVFIITVNRWVKLGLAAAVVITLAGCGGPQPTTPAAHASPIVWPVAYIAGALVGPLVGALGGELLEPAF